MRRIIVLIVFIGLTGALSAALAAPSPEELRKTAEAVYRSGSHDDAYEMYSKLVTTYPADRKITFGYGIVCMELGLFSQAVIAFERVVEMDPEYLPAQVQLAMLQMKAGNNGIAQMKLEALLAKRPPTEMSAKINALLKEIEKKGKVWHISGRLDAGMFYDDNINVGPDAETVRISPITFGTLSIDELTVNEVSQPADAEGVSLNLAVNGVRDVGRHAEWVSIARLSYFQNWISDYKNNETKYGQLACGFKNTSAKSRIELPVHFTQIEYGHNPLVNRWGIRPSLTTAKGNEVLSYLTTEAIVEQRDYDVLNGRDSTFWSLSEKIKKISRLSGNNISLRGGIASDLTDDKAFEYLEFFGEMEGRIVKSKGAFYARCRYAQSEYSKREVLSPTDREDSFFQFGVGGTLNLSRQAGLELIYLNTNNDSTFGLYQYDKSIVMLNMLYSF